MSRVHDALRRAEQLSGQAAVSEPESAREFIDTEVPPLPAELAPPRSLNLSLKVADTGLLSRVRHVPLTRSQNSQLIDLEHPHEAPAEEFRSLRTRLNHMQSLRPIHSVVVTSASPAEGKSFAAVNLAIAESQLENNHTLLIDCDFRRPILHSLFGVDRGPGMTDILQGTAELEDCILHVGSSNLYLLPAGEAVVNPLELLNLREMKLVLDQLPRTFNWVILDSPPLLFAADASLMSTMCSGVLLVVRIGSTTIDSVTRAMQSLCEDNVLGIIVNGARRGEMYSKYTYYHSYQTPDETAPAGAGL